MRQSLSVTIITLNAGEYLVDCLESAQFADEILIVDSGSSDDTVAIAQRFGARVIGQEWLGYGRQKQFAVENAAHDWVLCLDADERVSQELAHSIANVLKNPTFLAYQCARCNRFLGRWLRHGEGYPDWNIRLYHRAHGRWRDVTVHEHVATDVAAGELRGDLLHESERGLEEYVAKQNRYTTLQAQALYAAGARATVLKLLTSPVLRFVKFYLFRRGFLDGIPGLVHIAIGCMNSFMKYAKLYQLRRRDSAQ